MRICLVSQEYPPETAKGGIGTQTYLKAHGLAQLGHETYVISRAPAGGRTEVRTGEVLVVRIASPSNRIPIHTEVADWISYSAEVAAELHHLNARVGLDLVEFPEWACEGYFHLINRTHWNSVLTVIQLHGPLVMFAHTIGWPEIESEFYRVGSSLESTCLRLADAVYSSSQCSADWCARHYILAGKSIPVMHAGVDTGLFAPQSVPKAKRPTIVFAGKIAENKGVFMLLEAALGLAAEFPGLHLRLLGRGDEKTIARLRQRAAGAGYHELLDLPGFIQREDLPQHFSRAHIFAAPSIYEGGPGFVYLEAMACGLPVIACEGSGAAEVIRHGESGLLVPPGNVQALADALKSLLKSPEAREKTSRFARQHALASSDSAACLRKLETYYAGLIERHGARGA